MNDPLTYCPDYVIANLKEEIKSLTEEQDRLKKLNQSIKDAWNHGAGFALVEACEKLVKDGNDPIGSSFLSQIMKEEGKLSEYSEKLFKKELEHE
jgi:hypothetical protein